MAKIPKTYSYRRWRKQEKHQLWWLMSLTFSPALLALCLRASSRTSRKSSTDLFQILVITVEKPRALRYKTFLSNGIFTSYKRTRTKVAIGWKMNLCSWAYEHRFIGPRTYVVWLTNICSFLRVLFLFTVTFYDICYKPTAAATHKLQLLSL